jgi:hypothetical protein
MSKMVGMMAWSQPNTITQNFSKTKIITTLVPPLRNADSFFGSHALCVISTFIVYKVYENLINKPVNLHNLVMF